MTKRCISLLLVICTSGCTALAVRKLDMRFGPEAPRDRVATSPEEDTLTVVPGFLGSYPNAFFKVPQAELMGRYGIRRSDPGFWAHSDLIFGQVELFDYPDRGVLDYSRIENR